MEIYFNPFSATGRYKPPQNRFKVKGLGEEEFSGRKPSVPMIAILLSSSAGLSIEWLTGVSQVPGSRPDVFSCELKI